jgi:hypothetical protein
MKQLNFLKTIGNIEKEQKVKVFRMEWYDPENGLAHTWKRGNPDDPVTFEQFVEEQQRQENIEHGWSSTNRANEEGQ